MRILFFMRSFRAYFRQFENGFRELLGRGHELHMARDPAGADGGEDWAMELRDAYGERVAWSSAPDPAEETEWYELRRRTRLTRDYLYFLRPEFESAPLYVRRAERRTPANAVRLFRLPMMRSSPVLAAATALTHRIEDALPHNPRLVEYIEELRPDVVLVTPHLMPGSLHTDIVRCAQSLGLPTGICVSSWDNLSCKQLIRVRPDLVTVWNEGQREEAAQIHDLPPETVTPTGAQVYDQWFEWQASERTQFCARVGLPADRPYVLYLGGTYLPAEMTEAQFALRWLEELRRCDDPVVRDVPVLIRPHPNRADEWRAVDFSGQRATAVWPPDNDRMPVSSDAKADFYDSIFHSATVVGVNTSAMIEAGIVGRRVHTVMLPEVAAWQVGTPYFHHLTETGGGLLRVARDYREHFAHLSEVLEAEPSTENPNRKFIEAFVRPHGIDRPAAPIFADAIERAASLEPARPGQTSRSERALRRALRGYSRLISLRTRERRGQSRLAA